MEKKSEDTKQYDEGYEDGYAAGKRDGYDIGYTDGYDAAERAAQYDLEEN